MAVYNVEGVFQVRTGTPEQWMENRLAGRGAHRVLKRGEIGYELGTSNFKIGDGQQEYQSLPYITPIPNNVNYAYRLGDENASYTYDELKDILDDISGGGSGSLVSRVEDLETRCRNIESNLNQFYSSTSAFPVVGKEGPLYIAQDTGDIYFFNVEQIEDKPIGYIKLTNSFSKIICEL